MFKIHVTVDRGWKANSPFFRNMFKLSNVSRAYLSATISNLLTVYIYVVSTYLCKELSWWWLVCLKKKKKASQPGFIFHAHAYGMPSWQEHRKLLDKSEKDNSKLLTLQLAERSLGIQAYKLPWKWRRYTQICSVKTSYPDHRDGR